MKKLFFVFGCQLIVGCATFNMDQIYDSEKSLAVAQEAMGKINYENLIEKTLTKKSTVKLKLPVRLYVNPA